MKAAFHLTFLTVLALALASCSQISQDEAGQVESRFSNEIVVVNGLLQELPDVFADRQYGDTWFMQKKRELEGYRFFSLEVSSPAQPPGYSIISPPGGASQYFRGHPRTSGNVAIGKGAHMSPSANITIYRYVLSAQCGGTNYQVVADFRAPKDDAPRTSMYGILRNVGTTRKSHTAEHSGAGNGHPSGARP